MMHLKAYLFGSILIILATSCNQRSAVKEASNTIPPKIDSGSVVQAAVVETELPQEDPEPDEPPIETAALTAPQFDFFTQPITDDVREDSMVNALARLIRQFNTEKYVTISMTYTHADPVMPGEVHEEETWYYDADRKLCAYSKKYESARTTENSHYLFSNNELVAMTLDTDFFDEGAGYTNSIRIASTECPRCGVSISNDDGDGYEVSEIDQSSLNTYANDCLRSHDDMLKAFKEIAEVTKQDERFTAFVIVNSNTGIDTIKYSVDPNLAHKFFKKALNE
jgi:hypothetical protein